METPRDVVHIRGDFTGNSDQRIELRSERGLRFNRELFKLLKVDAEKGQALAGIVVEISGNARPLFFLSARETASQGLQLFLGTLAFGDVLIKGEGADELGIGKEPDAVEFKGQEGAVSAAALRVGVHDAGFPRKSR